MAYLLKKNEESRRIELARRHQGIECRTFCPWTDGRQPCGIWCPHFQLDAEEKHLTLTCGAMAPRLQLEGGL